MAFSNLVVPNVAPIEAGGPILSAMKNINALSAQNLEIQKQRIANQIQQPYANMAQPFADAALQLAQAQPKLTLGQANQANAQAGYLGTEADVNRFKIKYPQYMSPEGYLYSQPLPGADNTNTGATPSPTNTDNTLSPTNQGGTNAVGTIPSVAPINPIGSMQAGNTAPSNPMTMPLNMPAPKTFGQMIMQQRLAQAMAAQAGAEQKIKENNAWAFKTLPSDQQQAVIAQGVGAGLEPQEVMTRLGNGQSMGDILQSQGFDPSNPPPLQYSATAEDRKNINMRKQAMAQVNSVSDWIAKSTAPYSRTIHGISPALIADAVSGQNKDQVVNYLAAQMISPDLSGWRIQTASLRPSRGMVQEMQTRALQMAHTLPSTIPGDWVKEALQLATTKLDAAANAANDAMENPYTQKKSSKSDNDPLGIR